jgi:organic hydroperoxide reductase OsmC/OhrA
MAARHLHEAHIEWTGNRGSGTSAYRAYDRTWNLASPGKAVIACSNDPSLGGDPARHNPEDLLVASLSSCHMLWFLHLCSEAGVVVTGYVDDASGTMAETADGGGHFTAVVLRPRVTVAAGSDRKLAASLHERAHHLCFIANSVNFPVTCEPTVEEA